MFSKTDQDVAAKKTEPSRLSDSAADPSILNGDLTIHGDLITDGEIQIDGTVIGDVKSRVLTLGPTAKVEGSLSATDVRLNGSFKGQILADNVTLGETATVLGDIAQTSMTIEPGANFEGSVRRLRAGETDGVAQGTQSVGARRAARENARADGPAATP